MCSSSGVRAVREFSGGDGFLPSKLDTCPCSLSKVFLCEGSPSAVQLCARLRIGTREVEHSHGIDAAPR